MFRSLCFFLTMLLSASIHAQIINLPESHPSPIATVNGVKWVSLHIFLDPSGVEGLAGTPKVVAKFAQALTQTISTMRPDSTMVDSVRTFLVPLPEITIELNGVEAYLWWNTLIDTTKTTEHIVIGDALKDAALTGYLRQFSLADSLATWRRVLQ